MAESEEELKSLLMKVKEDRIEPRSPTLQVDSLSAEPQGKPTIESMEFSRQEYWSG